MKQLLYTLPVVFASLPKAFAHDEGAAVGSGAILEPCDITSQCGEVTGDFIWEVFVAQPSFAHKMEYFGDYLLMPNFHWFALILFVIVAALFGLRWKLHKKKKKEKADKKKILVSVVKTFVVYLVLLVLVYSITAYYQEQADKGIIVCKSENECTISKHIHSEIHVTNCGEDVSFPRDTGQLSKTHTHKEKGIIHWHDSTSYDKVKEELIDTSELTVQAFLEQVGVPFDGQTLQETSNGDVCNGEEGEWKLWVDQELQSNPADYVWDDGEVLHLMFVPKGTTEAPEGLDWEYSGP